MAQYRFLPILLFLAFFWSVLFGDQQFGYRDGAHFYYPLYRYVQEELAAGRLPLWNPYENLGQPLAANPTTALFYPGKLVFLLPIDFTTAYHWFVSGHVLLAALLAYRLARAWRCSEEAAVLAGICYAFGGNVLFQHTNVPFLIGAAWFPESLLQAERMFRCRSFRPAVLWGTVLALMILGGDPQAAYHAILCAVGLILFIRNRPNGASYNSPGRKPWVRWAIPGSRPGLTPWARLLSPFQDECFRKLALGFSVMFVLAAIQILPAWELSRLSDRSLPSHSAATYLFSVPCLRLVEFFWPNAGGVQFPVNARWFNVLNNDVWVPSFYMGLVPMILAVWAMIPSLRNRPNDGSERVESERVKENCKTRYFDRLRLSHFFTLSLSHSSRRDTFLVLLLLFFVLGSLGKWGGVYPLLNLLPGYGTFRYPAKLLTVAALPLAMLAGRGFDRLFRDDQFVARIYDTWLVSWVVPFVAMFWVQHNRVSTNILDLSIPTCPLFGPFDGMKAHSVAVDSILQPVIVFFLFIIPWNTDKMRLNRRWAPYLLVLVALDLFLANHWMVATVPRSDSAATGRSSLSPLVSLMGDTAARTAQGLRPGLGSVAPSGLEISPEGAAYNSPGRKPWATGRDGTIPPRAPNLEPRIYRFPEWYPLAFKYTSSKNRLSEIVRWERATLSPKYSLSERIGVVDVLGTAYPKEFYRIAGGLRWEILYGKPGDLEKRLENLGVEYVIASCGKELEADRLSLPENRPLCTNVWKLRNPRSRNYILFEPNRLELDVELAEPGTVIVPEQYWPGWRAFVDGKEYPIRCVDQVFRAVDLPAGKHRLRMVYQPLWFYIGAVVSGIGIVILCYSAKAGGVSSIRFLKPQYDSGPFKSLPNSNKPFLL